MRALERKLLRDLRRMWAQVLSIAALVAVGVMTVVAMFSTYQSLDSARRTYYDEYRFAHVFARLERAPESLRHRLAAIPGVSSVQSRVVQDVLIDLPGLDEPAAARLVSVPAPRAPMLNDVHLRAGRWVESGRAHEVIASERFALANQLEPGDTLQALVNGRWRSLHIVGLGLSPEFVYEVSGAGFGDERLFGVLWMDRDALAAAFTMEDAFNDVSLVLAPGASEPAVLAQVDALIGRYGGLGAHTRKDQASDLIVSSELGQLRVMGQVVPALFLAIAAFLLNVVLSRLVATEREEIAILKAFGYSNGAVALHFLGFALAAALIGTAAGILGGFWLGSAYTELYERFFRFPDLSYQISWGAVAAAAVFSTAAALAGALVSVRAAASLPPAEAMRPPAPARFRPLLLERLGLGHLVSAAARMLLRNVERRPVRSALSALGLGLAMAVLVFGIFMFESINAMGDLQFRRIQREDIVVNFRAALPEAAATGLAHVRGVTRVEPYRMTPVRVRSGHRARITTLTGVPADGQLRRLVDLDGRAYTIPPAGLVLGTALADAIGVAPGDLVQLELLERGGQVRDIVVAATIDQMFGSAAYMESTLLSQVLREAPRASGAYLAVDRAAETAVLARLKRMPAVAGAASRNAQLKSFEAQVSEGLNITATFIIIFAALIAVGVIYNGARISLSERGRELASLRVLGFTRREATRLLLGEQAVLTLFGLPLGSALGIAISALLVHAIESDLVRMPFFVTAETHVLAAAILLAMAGLTGFTIRRRVHQLDLVAVLKTRE